MGMKKSANETGNFCPLLQSPCVENKCAWWTRVIGKDRQTGEDYDHYGCAMGWIPVLLIEGANQTREAGAAIESLRNGVVKSIEGKRLQEKVITIKPSS